MLLFWLFHSSVDISTVFWRQLKWFGSDFGTQNPSQNGSRLRFEALKDVCCVKHVQNEAICCVVWCRSLHANVSFHCTNRGVLNDFHFACCLVNAILCLSNLHSKSLKMKTKTASEDVFLGVQKAYSLRIASKLNLKADFASNGLPNGTPNGVQNRGHELAVRASVRVGASGPAKQRFWTQFGATLTSLGTNFGSILGHFANMHVSRIDPLCLCC